MTAYDRKKYVLGAVKSILSQSLPRDLYEVIVVKNYEDKNIDSQLDGWKVLHIYSKEPGLGAKIYEGLQIARGEMISLLEDDDEFLPGKLEAVYRASRAGVDYYHNGRLVVNEAGKVLGTEGFGLRARDYSEKSLYLRYLHLFPWYNNSSISIARRILSDNSVALKRISTLLDAFIFMGALLNARFMLDDPRPLTLYRVSSYQSEANLSSLGSFIKARHDLLERHLKDAYLMFELSKDTPYQQFARYILIFVRLRYLGMPDMHSTFSISDFLFTLSSLPTLGLRMPASYLYGLLMPAMPKSLKAKAMAMYYNLKRSAVLRD